MGMNLYQKPQQAHHHSHGTVSEQAKGKEAQLFASRQCLGREKAYEGQSEAYNVPKTTHPTRGHPETLQVHRNQEPFTVAILHKIEDAIVLFMEACRIIR